MSATTLISVAEYLATNYRPDREYLEGEVKERNLGEYDHGRLQYMLSVYFGPREKALGVRGIVEQRVQVKANRFRIPDFCLVSRSNAIEQVLRTPPLLAVEVLSPSDSLEDIQERIDDYLAMGTPTVWVISPKIRRAWIYTTDGVREAKSGLLQASGLSLDVRLTDLFESE